jgi:DNA-binding MarR family transcriptional regulator
MTGPITAGRLAELTGLTTGAITGVVDRLERAGYVRRVKDPRDRRRVIVELVSKKAMAEIAPLYAGMAQAVDKLCARYSDEQLAVVLDFVVHANPLTQEAITSLREGG